MCGILVGIRIIAAATLAVVVVAAAEVIVAHRIVHQLLYLLELQRASPRTRAQHRQRPCAPAGTMDGTPTPAENRTGGRIVDRVVDRMVDRMVDRAVDRMVRRRRRLGMTARPRVVAGATVRPQFPGVQHVLLRRPSCQRACARTGITGGTIFRA